MTVTVARGGGAAVTQTNIVYSTTRVSGTVWAVYVGSLTPRGAETNMAQGNNNKHHFKLGECYSMLAGGRLVWLLSRHPMALPSSLGLIQHRFGTMDYTYILLTASINSLSYLPLTDD